MRHSKLKRLNGRGAVLSEPFTIYPNELVKRKVEDQIAIQALKIMLKTRLVDERMVILQRQGIITFAMSSASEEACAVGSAAALDLGDWMYPQYRESGILFWRGFSIEDY